MKIFLFSQDKKMEKHLLFFQKASMMPYKLAEMKEVRSSISLAGFMALEEVDLKFFFDYRIFPPHILNARPQWISENREMQVGDTIVQQVFLPPNKFFSQKIIFGVRITEIINEENRKGFTYQTLEGHVEKGKSTFLIEKQEGNLFFTIHTFSLPATFISRMLSRVFSVPYQAFCTKAALKNVQRTIKLQ
jgi:Domain of unknown function (DUF1990)